MECQEDYYEQETNISFFSLQTALQTYALSAQWGVTLNSLQAVNPALPLAQETLCKARLNPLLLSILGILPFILTVYFFWNVWDAKFRLLAPLVLLAQSLL